MAPRKKKVVTPAQPPEPKYPQVYETYGEPYMPEVKRRAEPPTDAVNGSIRIKRYRVTVEEIDEPIEVLRERLRKLWRTDERNIHHWDAFEAAAKKLGMCSNSTEFQKEFNFNDHGIERKKED